MIELDNDLRARQNARDRVRAAKKAQAMLATFSQQQIDAIVKNVAQEAAHHAETLAKMAAEETGFGNWQDKVLKNRFASLRVYDAIKEMKTVGIIHDDQVNKVMDVGVPLGVICALVPSTNPTSTVIYKTLIALKSGNAIIFSPHPGARQCSWKAIDIVKRAAEAAGAPAGCVDAITELTVEATSELMHSKDVSLILATGGEGMVRAAYASGTPTISGGPGNGPAFIERSADIPQAVKDIITSKTFDNGVICASEQSIIVERCISEEVRRELAAQGAYFMNESEAASLAALLLRANGSINPDVVGKTALTLSQMAGFTVPTTTRVLIAEQSDVSRRNPYSREKLCPVLGLYVAEDWKAACQRAMALLTNEGLGHTLVIHTRNKEVVRQFALEKPVNRILVNTPAALGGIGATTNISPALTLGCGAVGGGSSSDNVGPMNLLNIRKVGYGVRTIDELRVPGSRSPTPSSLSVSPENNPHHSILDDVRFNTPTSPAADNRFGQAVPATAEAEISEQHVEQVIRQVLKRLGQ
ncbi:acetaldehyde dehydrogenase (acetylating) [Erwinia mallotivora]|uniref:Acetaldehyde dehydrogenase n=1 Tax=Erwinia mallotivora TaxID=69222 RepID=A0A014NCM1_9GAMM|nr:acetaldehyde dehydrogenase (acetylating) [Erwinia mallotivora]EXU77153.1 acetaldehyde dehydrogenase [Erwinia mallotivora]